MSSRCYYVIWPLRPQSPYHGNFQSSLCQFDYLVEWCFRGKVNKLPFFCFLLFLTCGKVQTVNVLGFVCKQCGLGGNCSSLHEHSHRQNKEEHCGYVPHKVVFAKTAGVPGLKTGQQLLASTRGHGFIASDATVWTLLHPSSVSTLACLVPSCWLALLWTFLLRHSGSLA